MKKVFANKTTILITIIAFILIVILTLVGFNYRQAVFASALVTEHYAGTEYSTNNITGENYDIRINHKVRITDDFCDKTVIVTLRQAYSVPNNTLTLPSVTDSDNRNSFYYSMIEYITDLTYFTYDALVAHNFTNRRFNQIFELRLREAGKRNVLDAIYYLEQLDKVLAAEPSFICYSVTHFESEMLDSIIASSATIASSNNFWGLNRINVTGAHAIATNKGAGVYVGVMENGVLNHASLENRNFPGNIPSGTIYGTHPLRVAGVIAGVNSGVAPRANMYRFIGEVGEHL